MKYWSVEHVTWLESNDHMLNFISYSLTEHTYKSDDLRWQQQSAFQQHWKDAAFELLIGECYAILLSYWVCCEESNVL